MPGINKQIINTGGGGGGSGDMTKAVYDVNNSGYVDSSHKVILPFINKTGSTLTEGTIVYLKTSSASANYPEAVKANASTETTSSKTIGAVYEDVANDATGYIITHGEADNLDTSSYSVGDRLWLATTDGLVTTTRPSPPNHAVFIGTVTRSQAGNGRISYTIMNGYEVDELHDVSFTSLANDDIFQRKGGLWVNRTPAQVKTDLAITGADVANTPAGNIASTTVQTAINELDTEKAKLSGENTFSGNQTIGSNALFVDSTNTKAGVGTSSLTSKFTVYQSDTEIGTGGGITVEQAGAGDAKLQFLLTGVRRWSMGIDNSDSDKFKIGINPDLGTTPILAMDTSGNAVFSGTLGGSNLSGTNTGDQTITLTSDVTGSGTGSFATTIANNAVTLAKMADMATGSLIYRKTAGTGDPEVQTLATLKTDLGLTGTNSGDQTTIVGITGTKAQFNTAVTDGDFLYVGDAPTAHTHTSSDITDFASASRAQTEAELVAGANITITPSGTGATRQLTIASTGGGGGTITVQDEGSTTSTTVTTLNFTGAGVTASGAGVTATINIPGGGGGSATTYEMLRQTQFLPF